MPNDDATLKLIHKDLGASMTLQDGEQSFMALISNSAVDRDGDVLLPTGLDATEYMKNPIITWNHSLDVPPIGKAAFVRQSPDGVQAKGIFAQRPDNHHGEWLPNTVHSLMQQKVIRGVSVGFQETGKRRPTPEDTKAFGPSCLKVVTRWKLYEFAVTPIQCNPEAVVTAVSKNFIKRALASSLFPDIKELRPSSPMIVVIKPFEVDKPPKRIKRFVDVDAIVKRAVARRLGRMTY